MKGGKKQNEPVVAEEEEEEEEGPIPENTNFGDDYELEMANQQHQPEEEEEAAEDGDGEVEEEQQHHQQQQQQQQQQQDQVYGEEEGDEEDERDEENEGVDEEQEEYDQQHDEEDRPDDADVRPKLDDGFYEIEAVRRKRVRKGQLQYLIKWRGWPETANTWEPLENLQSCSDVIEAFEESLRSGKRSSRRRKRKSGTTHTQPRKKQQRHSTAAATNSVRPAKLRKSVETMHSYPVKESTFAENATLHHQHDDRVVKMVETSKQAVDNGRPSTSLDIQERKEYNELDMNINEHEGTISAGKVNKDKFAIHIQEGKSSKGGDCANGLAKVDQVQPVPNTRSTGARKRKSGSVKRFKLDSVLNNPNDSQNAMARINVDSSYRVEPLGAENSSFMNYDIGCKDKSDGSKNAYIITEIIKPISYSASVTNNVQDVLVTFAAMRSDGVQVMVDNKFLKANHPLLLIDFYEQHLRYSANELM